MARNITFSLHPQLGSANDTSGRVHYFFAQQEVSELAGIAAGVFGNAEKLKTASEAMIDGEQHLY